MSIASDLSRLSTAKGNIATAIANKGVTVPAGTKMDGFSALIGQIATGKKVATGNFSGSGTRTQTITGIAFTPANVVIAAYTNSGGSAGAEKIMSASSITSTTFRYVSQINEDSPHISTAGTMSYNSGTKVLTLTAATDARWAFSYYIITD